MNKANYDKLYIERSLNEGKSYEALGREFGVSGNSIKKFVKKSGINIPKRRKINPIENFNKGKILKEKTGLSEIEKEIVREKRRSRKHNNIIKKNYSSLEIPLISPGCCPICGSYHCNNEFCKKHNFLSLIGLVKLGLDPKKIGTLDIFEEFNRIRDNINDLYWKENKSMLDLGKMFEYSTGRFPSGVLDQLGIPRRSLSDSTKNAYMNGKLNPINPVSLFKQGNHVTWENKQVFLRSSYELDYAIKLDQDKVSYEVEFLRISYFNSQKNEFRVAIPDFYLPESNTIVEVKSDFTLDINEMMDKFNKYISLGYRPILVLEKEEIDLFNIENLISPSRLKKIQEKNIKNFK